MACEPAGIEGWLLNFVRCPVWAAMTQQHYALSFRLLLAILPRIRADLHELGRNVLDLPAQRKSAMLSRGLPGRDLLSGEPANDIS
jgi:hypothetical protein